MADDQEPTGPSLEPPSFFRRRKKDADRTTAPTAAPVAPDVDDSPTTILDDVPTADLGPKPTAPPLFADEAPAAVQPASSDPNVLVSEPEPNTNGSLDAPRPSRKAPKAARTGPLLPGRVAAGLAGLVVGGAIVGLTYACFGLCESIQGTDSCGGPGIFLLVAILVVAVIVGSLVLRLGQVPDPGATSFMAVGLTSVIALLFLVDELFDWWMLIAIPVVSIATYVLAHWVTTTFVEPASDN